MEPLIIFGVLLGMGLILGSINESAHYKSIKLREQNTMGQAILSVKTLPADMPVTSATLVLGSVVVSKDYFKSIVASLKGFFGGEIKSYSSLIDRARREAILRMKEAAPDADFFLNFRFETTTLSSGRGNKQSVGCVEILAYATAIWLKK